MKKIKSLLDKCESICLKTMKKFSVSSEETINALFGVLVGNEDPSLVNFRLTKEEKNNLIRDYNKIFTDQGKNLFWEDLNGRRSLTTA